MHGHTSTRHTARCIFGGGAEDEPQRSCSSSPQNVVSAVATAFARIPWRRLFEQLELPWHLCAPSRRLDKPATQAPAVERPVSSEERHAISEEAVTVQSVVACKRELSSVPCVASAVSASMADEEEVDYEAWSEGEEEQGGPGQSMLGTQA